MPAQSPPQHATRWQLLLFAVRLVRIHRLEVRKGWSILLLGVALLLRPLVDISSGLGVMVEGDAVSDRMLTVLRQAELRWCDPEQGTEACAELRRGGAENVLMLEPALALPMDEHERETVARQWRQAIEGAQSVDAMERALQEALVGPAEVPGCEASPEEPWIGADCAVEKLQIGLVLAGLQSWLRDGYGRRTLASLEQARTKLGGFELVLSFFSVLIAVPLAIALVGAAGVRASMRLLRFRRTEPRDFTALSMWPTLRLYLPLVGGGIALMAGLVATAVLDNPLLSALVLVAGLVAAGAPVVFTPWFVVARGMRIAPAIGAAWRLTRGHRIGAVFEVFGGALHALFWVCLPQLAGLLLALVLQLGFERQVAPEKLVSQWVLLFWVPLIAPLALHVPFVYFSQRFERLTGEVDGQAGPRPL